MDERVSGLNARFNALELSVNQGFHQIEASVADLAKEFSKSKNTNWGAISVVFSILFGVMTTIGYLSLNPIRGDLGRLEHSFEDTQKNVVARSEHEIRWKEETRRVERLEQQIAERVTIREIDLITKLRDQQIASKDADRLREVEQLQERFKTLLDRLDRYLIQPHITKQELGK